MCPMVFIDPSISDESELQPRSWKDRLRSLEKTQTQMLESLSSGFDEGFPYYARTKLSAADSSQFEREHDCVLHCWSVPMHVIHVFDVRELPLGFLFLLVLTLSLFLPCQHLAG